MFRFTEKEREKRGKERERGMERRPEPLVFWLTCPLVTDLSTTMAAPVRSISVDTDDSIPTVADSATSIVTQVS